MLRRASPEQAVEVAERIRRQIAAIAPSALGTHEPVTVSIGAAVGDHRLGIWVCAVRWRRRDPDRVARPLTRRSFNASGPYLACRIAGLGERHRAHPEPANAERAAVPRDVVRRHGRACQDELTGPATCLVDRTSDMVPDGRHELPLIDQSWSRTVEKERRIEQTGGSRVIVDHRPDLAC